MESYHCHIQLFLNVQVDILGALIRVVDWEGLCEQQRGICTHLKVRNLETKAKRMALGHSDTQEY